MKYLSAVVLTIALSAGAYGQGRAGGGARGFGGGGRAFAGGARSFGGGHSFNGGARGFNGGSFNGGGRNFNGGAGKIAPPLSVFGVLPFRTYGSFNGFGNILFPGTGNAPPIVSPFDFPYTFATRLGVTVSGYRSPFINGFNGCGGFGCGGAGYGDFGYGGGAYPVPYPVPAGGDYGYGGYPQEQQPPVTVVMPPQGQPSSPVTINQNFGQGTAPATTAEAMQPDPSGVTVYQAPSPAPAAARVSDQQVYLIALKDSTVYPAVGYWVEGDALHYITPQGKHNQVSLGLVDRKTSERLNQGLQTDFHLPPG